MYSSPISSAPGRLRPGACEVVGMGSEQYFYLTPSQCDSNGNINPNYPQAASVWVSIVPIIFVISYVLNAVVISIVARKRGTLPCINPIFVKVAASFS
jgi:hypothetical protein